VRLRATAQDLTLEPADNARLANLCGQLDEHLRQIERRLGVQIANRGNRFRVSGEPQAADAGSSLLRHLFDLTKTETLSPERVHYALQEIGMRAGQAVADDEDVGIKTRRGLVRARGPTQQQYLANMKSADLNFGVGPAGTGKTYLAVACAVEALENDSVRRLVLVRPAVEAGERLGFLPGDFAQKVDPYLRPIYDALYEMLGFDRVAKLVERNVIEIAPLAYMRGRTLNESFVILDEAQNATVEQVKMFLTRIGFGARAVVTGDITQSDLPRHRPSGLRHALGILRDVEGVRFTQFTARDVVRHPLVQRIVEAYERDDARSGSKRSSESSAGSAGPPAGAA
jgi:phosphate starvation-inducible protein PhoH and related proteins